MNKMVERVAMIIGVEDWATCSGSRKEWHRAIARAVIEAMREPTEEIAALYSDEPIELFASERAIATEFWSAIIDEMLKDTG